MAMTVAELIQALQQFDRSLPAQAIWDDCLWDVGQIECLDGIVIMDVSESDCLEYYKSRRVQG
jgi:hypothetical protein